MRCAGSGAIVCLLDTSNVLSPSGSPESTLLVASHRQNPPLLLAGGSAVVTKWHSQSLFSRRTRELPRWRLFEIIFDFPIGQASAIFACRLIASGTSRAVRNDTRLRNASLTSPRVRTRSFSTFQTCCVAAESASSKSPLLLFLFCISGSAAARCMRLNDTISLPSAVLKNLAKAATKSESFSHRSHHSPSSLRSKSRAAAKPLSAA